MAANLVSTTVLELNGKSLLQDGVQNIFALNKQRCRKVSPVDSGNDSQILFMFQQSRQHTAYDFQVDDTFATIETALVTNAYTAGQGFTFPVLTENGNPVNENLIFNIDSVIYAIADPANPGAQSIVMYDDANRPTPVKYIVNLTVAQVVTLTTT